MNLREAETLARQEIAEHLEGWTFRWDNARRRLGCCRYRTRTISLSKPITQQLDEAEVLDTIRHEIAHALAGHKAGHGPEWRVQARYLGARPQRCASVEVDHSDALWQGTCPAGHSVSAYRAPKRVKACSKCCNGTFDPAHLITWTKGGVPAVPRSAQYRAELASLGLTQDDVANKEA